MEVPSTEAGIVKEIRVKLGDKVSEGSPIVVIETAAGADGKPAAAAASPTAKPASAAPVAAAQSQPATPVAAAAQAPEGSQSARPAPDKT